MDLFWESGTLWVGWSLLVELKVLFGIKRAGVIFPTS